MRRNNPLELISFNFTFIAISCLVFLIAWGYSLYSSNHLMILNGNECSLFFEKIYMLFTSNYIIQAIWGLVVSFVIGISSFLLDDQFSLSPKQTYTPLFFCLLFIAATKKFLFISPGSIAFIFFLISIIILFRTYKAYDSTSVFNLFFILSIGSLFYYDLLIYGILFLICLYNFQSLSFKTFLASLIGISLPYLIVGLSFYIIGGEYLFIDNIQRCLFNWQTNIVFNIKNIVLISIITILLLLAFLSNLNLLNFEKIRKRKCIFFLMGIFILSVILSTFHKENIFISIFSLSLILNYSIQKSNYFNFIIFLIWIIIGIYMYF